MRLRVKRRFVEASRRRRPGLNESPSPRGRGLGGVFTVKTGLDSDEFDAGSGPPRIRAQDPSPSPSRKGRGTREGTAWPILEGARRRLTPPSSPSGTGRTPRPRAGGALSSPGCTPSRRRSRGDLRGAEVEAPVEILHRMEDLAMAQMRVVQWRDLHALSSTSSAWRSSSQPFSTTWLPWERCPDRAPFLQLFLPGWCAG